jgi:hypothetical protein
MDAITARDSERLDRVLDPALVSHGALGGVEGAAGFKNGRCERLTAGDGRLVSRATKGEPDE